MPRASRPSDDVIEAIVQLVRGGNDPLTVATYHGILPAQFHRLMDRDKGFRAQIDRAVAFSDLNDEAVIGKATESAWQAAVMRQNRRRLRQTQETLRHLRALTT